MKKHRGKIVFVLLCFGFVAALYAMLRADSVQTRPSSAQISVVLYGQVERWRSLDQGISQACGELGLEKPIILPSTEGAQAQIEQLRREVANGADGLIVAATNSDELLEYLEAVSFSIPVIMVENGVGDALPCVTANNAQMARDLASSIAKDGGEMAILEANLNRASTRERYTAFLEAATALNITVRLLSPDESALGLEGFLTQSLLENPPEVLLALDNDAMEAAVLALTATSSPTRLYGFGNSDKVVHALDRGLVTEVCFQNEFSLGYLATITLAKQMDLQNTNALLPPIEYRLVRRETMYEPDIERLLFPIIQ